MAYRASNSHCFTASKLLLGVLIALLVGCSQARQSMRTVDPRAPKPGYVQIPPCDRPSHSLEGAPGLQLPRPSRALLSRREEYAQRTSCLGCGDVFWNSWQSDPPRPQDRISFHHPAEIYRRGSPECLPADNRVE